MQCSLAGWFWVDRKKAMMKPGEKLGFFREVVIYEHVYGRKFVTSSFGNL